MERNIKNRRKSFYWKVVADDLEKRILLEMADADRISPNEALRYCVREVAKRDGYWPVPTQRHEILGDEQTEIPV